MAVVPGGQPWTLTYIQPAGPPSKYLGVIANFRGVLDRALRFYQTALGEYRNLG